MKMLQTIIKGGTIVTATDCFVADVGISEGKIVAIGSELRQQDAYVIPAENLYVMPGGIDVHTHLDMPFGGTTTADDFLSGTTAAAIGGTTTIIDFAIQPKGKTLQEGLDLWHAKAEGNCIVDYSFHMIIIDLSKNQIEEMDKLVNQGVTSFKLFMAYPGVLMVDDGTLFQAMLRAKENGGLICIHAENGPAIEVLIKRALAEGKTTTYYHALTRPAIMEAEATRRAIALAEIAGAPVYIVHLSAAEALEEVKRAREKGILAYAETCPQYLFLSDEDLKRPDGAKFVCSPPVRPKGNEERLWRGLATNTLQVVSTDHCSFNYHGTPEKPGKELGKDNFNKIPNGIPGIENRLMLLFDAAVNGKRFSINRFVELVATNPARLFGLYPQKGTIAIGSDADIVIINPRKTYTISARTHHMNVDYNPYEGRTVTGTIEHVLLRGKHIVKNGKLIGQKGDGKFIKRSHGCWTL